MIPRDNPRMASAIACENLPSRKALLGRVHNDRANEKGRSSRSGRPCKQSRRARATWVRHEKGPKWQRTT
jgi:hypothetical protein